MSKEATVTLLICLPTVVSLIPLSKGFLIKIKQHPAQSGAPGTKVYVKILILHGFMGPFGEGTDFELFWLLLNL
jgi:hypothetical protein